MRLATCPWSPIVHRVESLRPARGYGDGDNVPAAANSGWTSRRLPNGHHCRARRRRERRGRRAHGNPLRTHARWLGAKRGAAGRR